MQRLQRDLMLRIVRYAEVPSTPWKNGLGVTRQLAIYPSTSNAEAFEWRLSIAQLTHTAAFSRFAGIERCLAVLEGSLTLQREGCEALALSPQSEPLHFSGEGMVTGVVEHGAVLDLNLMWQPTLWHARMSRLTTVQDVAQLRPAGLLILCSLMSRLDLQVAGQSIDLGLYDLLVIDTAAVVLAAVPGPSLAAYCIELQRR